MKPRTAIQLSLLLTIAILLTACRPISVQPEPTATAAEAGSETDQSEVSLQPTASATITVVQPPESSTIVPTATRQRLQAHVYPVGGNDGNINLRGIETLNEGRVIILPPNIPIQESDPDAAVNYHFDSGRIALRVEIRDVEAGDEDGDGIDAVIFRIFDNLERGQGNVVYVRSDNLPPYCMLPDIDQCQKDDKDLCCTPLFFGLDKQWPNDEDVVDGDYRLEIEILPETGLPATWQWRFSIGGATSPTPTPTSTPTPTPTPTSKRQAEPSNGDKPPSDQPPTDEPDSRY